MASSPREEEEKGSSWSDLPEDILRLAVQRLYITDRIRVRAVCKNWRVSAPSFDKLPLLLNYRVSSNRIQCSVLDLHHHKQPLFTEKEKGWTPPPGSISRTIACGSRKGWVLFYQVSTGLLHDPRIHYVHEYYVYNPHTGALVSLPRLELQQHYGLYVKEFAVFSDDFSVAVPTVCDKGRNLLLSTYTMGDKSWKTRKFPCPNPRFVWSSDVAYMDGSLYYYNSEKGDLSSFRIATGEWRVHSEKRGALPMSESWPYFVAYGGYLHLVYMISTAVGEPECHIFRYDWTGGDWKRMESLEGAALFLGDPLNGVHSFGVSAETEETKMVANRVYYMTNFSPTIDSKPNFLVYGATTATATPESDSQYSFDHIKISNPPCWAKESGDTLWMWMTNNLTSQFD